MINISTIFVFSLFKLFKLKIIFPILLSLLLSICSFSVIKSNSNESNSLPILKGFDGLTELNKFIKESTDILFIATKDGYLHALDKTKNELWKIYLDKELISSNISTRKIRDDLILYPFNERLYIYKQGKFISLDIFIRDLVKKQYTSINDLLLLGKTKTTVFIIDIETGNIIKKSDEDDNLITRKRYITQSAKKRMITVLRIDYILTCLGTAEEQKFWNASYSDIIIQRGNENVNDVRLHRPLSTIKELVVDSNCNINLDDIITVHSYFRGDFAPIKIFDRSLSDKSFDINNNNELNGEIKYLTDNNKYDSIINDKKDIDIETRLDTLHEMSKYIEWKQTQKNNNKEEKLGSSPLCIVIYVKENFLIMIIIILLGKLLYDKLKIYFKRKDKLIINNENLNLNDEKKEKETSSNKDKYSEICKSLPLNEDNKRSQTDIYIRKKQPNENNRFTSLTEAIADKREKNVNKKKLKSISKETLQTSSNKGGDFSDSNYYKSTSLSNKEDNSPKNEQNNENKDTINNSLKQEKYDSITLKQDSEKKINEPKISSIWADENENEEIEEDESEEKKEHKEKEEPNENHGGIWADASDSEEEEEDDKINEHKETTKSYKSGGIVWDDEGNEEKKNEKSLSTKKKQKEEKQKTKGNGIWGDEEDNENDEDNDEDDKEDNNNSNNNQINNENDKIFEDQKEKTHSKKEIKKQNEEIKLTRLDEDFEDLEKIGQGGFGIVLKARHKIDKGIYAIKIINLSGVKNREDVINEAKTMLNLNNKHIIQYKICWFQKTLGSASKFITQNDSSSSYTSESKFNQSKSYILNLNQNGKTIQYNKIDDNSIIKEEKEEECEENSGRKKLSKSIYLDVNKSKIKKKYIAEDDDNINSYRIKKFKRIGAKYCVDFNDDSRVTSKSNILSKYDEESDTENASEYFFILMEYCDMLTLEKFINQHSGGSIDRKIIYIFTYQIMKCLKKIHSLGIIHRDIKPANIFISDNQIKLGDFGLATKFKKNNKFLLTKDLTGWTPLYSAPEQKNSMIYNEKVDIFACGITLFEMCSCFGTIMERNEAIRKLNNGNYINDELKKNYPEESKLIELMTKKNYDERPSAAEILSSDLFKKLQTTVDYSKE